MKKYAAVGIMLLAGLAQMAAAETTPDVTVKNISVTGQVLGDNVTITVDATVDVARRGALLDVVTGNLVYQEGKLPKRAALERNGATYAVRFKSRGEQSLTLTFAVAANRQEQEWRQALFNIPNAVIRQLTMICDRDDLEIQFGGAIQVGRGKNAAGKTEVTAYLNPDAPIDVRWKPQVRKLEGELAVTCDGRTVAVASVGALKLTTLFTYRVVQGALDRMSLEAPEQFNVTQVLGEDIREWRMENQAGGARLLQVTLSRPKDKIYILRVEGERVLSAFPCKFDLPVVVPRGVIRASGLLLLGTDTAVKLFVDKSPGLNQIDTTAFPRGKDLGETAVPARSTSAYQYAHVPFQMQITAEDIVTAMTADHRLTVTYEDNGATIDAVLDIEVRDAPVREITIDTDPAWAVAQVQGNKVADYDVQDAAGTRGVRVYFQEALLGHIVLNMRLERTLGDASGSFTLPRLSLRDARAERGYLVLKAEKGVRLKEQKADGLTEVHTASVPFRVPEAQRAYRFKSGAWTLQLVIEQADAAIHAELFHLTSLGEGALYGSVSITFRVEGAPVRKFVLKIPADYQNIEFTGRDVRSWERDGELVTVYLQEKVLGDYTLLLTYDQPFAYEGAELLAGGVETVSAASEMGYLALAGPSSLAFDAEKQRDAAVIPIAPEELPPEYALLVNDPVLKAFKCVGTPHITRLIVRRIGTQAMLDHVADHIALATRVSKEGEAVTEATYFIKNTSHQFLGINLPKKATLWSAKVDGVTVRVLDDGKGAMLIPIKRLVDANTPSRVELSYAESRPALRWFRSLSFTAPLSVAQSVFARWSLTGPEKLALVPAGGNMMAPVVPGTGLGTLLEFEGGIMQGMFRYSMGTVIALLVFALVAMAAAYVAGRRGAATASSIGMFALVVLAGVLAFIVMAWNFDNTFHAVTRPLLTGGRTMQAVAFTKSVTMADHDLTVTLRTMPAWLGSTGGILRLALGGLAGLIFIGRAVFVRYRPLTMAVGLTLVLWGLTAIPFMVKIAAALLIPTVLLLVWIGLLRRAFRRGKARRQAAPPLPAAAFAPPFETAPATGGIATPQQGACRLACILTMAGLLAATVAGLALAATKPIASIPPPPAPAKQPAGLVMQNVVLKIEAPDPVKTREAIAKVELTLTFTTDDPVSFRFFPANYILIDSTVSPKQGHITAGKDGFILHLDDDGSYQLTFKGYAPVIAKDGAWKVPVSLPPHLKNSVEVAIPATGWEVTTARAAWLEVAEKDKRTVGKLVLADTEADVVWQPRERKTRMEQTVVYCDLQTYAVLAPGLVNMTHVARYQIAQGELQTLRFAMPQGMSVTAVTGPGLGTWRFEPETRILEALLEKPVSGDLAITIITQIPQEGLPYDATIMAPVVQDCVRQRGAVALAAGAAVQIRVDDKTLRGFNRMNLGDFPAEAVQAALQGVAYPEPPEIKHAYRYHETPVNAVVHAERVLPEVRVAEQTSLDISDERLVLSARLSVAIARAGIFDLRIDLPDKFDIESLTGDEVAYWDEVRDGGHGVIVHFQKQALGARAINIVMGRMEKGIEAQIKVPRIGVRDAVKHVGTLAVSGERGVRLLTATKDGVSEVHPRELGIEQAGYLAFRILRPDWSVTLKTETLAPIVRADVLQRIDVSEGMIHGRAIVQYKIDQAGLKTFRLKAPAPGVSLTVSGRNIAKVNEVDKAAGIWEVELQGKVENRYTLDIAYQQPCDPKSARLKVMPLQTVGAESQKGYAVVFTAGRLQIKSEILPPGLYEDDARNVPATFGAGNLSDAILCYRTTRSDYALDLSVIRHESAEMLPARVEYTQLTSVLAEDGQMITRVEMKLNVGSLRALAATLPKNAIAWSVFVNGAAVAPLKERGKLLIPLESARAAGDAVIEVTYAAPADTRGGSGHQRIEGPQFNVPLANVNWSLYAPDGKRYYGFKGTMTHKTEAGDGIFAYGAEQYEQETRKRVTESNLRAEAVLKKGEKLWKEGKRAEAKQALEQAVNFSQGQQELNEDARIQYRNLMRQNTIVGFNDRRAALKKSQNAYEIETQINQVPQQAGQQGQWSADFGRQVEQQLDAKDLDNLNKVADKMLEQQAAAQVRATPIRVTLPVQGVRLPFYRELQIHPDSEMAVEFNTSDGRWLRRLGAAGAALGLLALFWLTFHILAARGTRGQPTIA